MGWLLFLIVAVLIVAGIVSASKRNRELKEEEEFDRELSETVLLKTSSGRAKVFREFIATPISISENGEIGVYDAVTAKTTVVNIKDIRGFELMEDGKNVADIGGAIVGGLLFGRVGAIIGGSVKNKMITKMDLVLKVDDFSKPSINIQLYRSDGKKDDFGGYVPSPPIDKVNEEVKELMNTLEFVEKKVKG